MKRESDAGKIFSSRWFPGWMEDGTQWSRLRTVAVCVSLAAVYFVAGKLGLKLAFAHPSATPVWPPTGITLVAFLLLGYRVWPGILVGAFGVNVTTAGSVATSLGIAIGNTLEGLVGAYLVNRFAGGVKAFSRIQWIFRFAIWAVILSTTLSPTIGVTSLAAGGFANWTDYGTIWLTWWLGDAVGNAIVAPVLLLWLAGPYPPRRDWRKLSEAAVLNLGLLFAGLIVFAEIFHLQSRNYPLEFLCIPFLIWAAFRFSALEAGMAVLMLAGIAIWGTLHGHGPFVRATPNESLLLLQAFMGVIGMMTIAVAAVVSERKQVEEELQGARDELERQATTDPLTALANYRRLVDAVQAEMDRSRRTERPFALLLFDLDHLKKVNDTHGHLAGSRALCRVANTMLLHCRAMDTAARYGGDEFVLLLPETAAKGARYVAERIAKQVANDPEQPPISVSFGIAVYPDNGETIEEIIRTADAGLYAMKGDGRRSSRQG